MSTTAPAARDHTTGPALPRSRGELSRTVRQALTRPAGTPLPQRVTAAHADPYGDDLQLALYLCYELHYRSFVGVDPGWEWESGLLRLRAEMEHSFLSALRADSGPPRKAAEALADILVEPVDGDGPSHFLKERGELWQFREYAAQRSLYHLKEADPHAWVIPRLTGRAKAAMVAVEYDEFGAGRPERIHARLFADLMADLGLDTAYGRYVDTAAAEMLTSVNLMSLFGLHRALRGALVGHFAAVETTSSPGSRRLAHGLRRVGAGPAAVHFYAEHVEADAVHEQIVRRDVVGGLLETEPFLDEDIAFGVDATEGTETRLGNHLLTAWRDGRTSLRTPL
ncbi:iron-containing redox enzyme family protein [Streptomyces mirabilis]|uniref:iron-containing redox enzyme family protein n=1 Tax=Streptomyces mirabilis TaxID=68239 RepID=UPI0021BF8DF9|nr:iron-containing redox enzyme family protein [Streptomyces mirabilis]MCT9113870.1 iron-containing redox enzyme family protein [Streptomyces mirabilis]